MADNASDIDGAMLELLLACIRIGADAASTGGLPDRIAQAGWDRLLTFADELRLGSVLAVNLRGKGLVPAVPAMKLPNGQVTVPMAIAQIEEQHIQRRTVLSTRLIEIVAALNAQGVVPLVLKGGRSLVTGDPAWRHLRDIDLLVKPAEARRAQEIIQQLGYRAAEEPRSRVVHHHLPELYREDLPGWIEVHRYGGPSRVEQFLPSAELLASAQPMDLAASTIAALPAHLHLLHGAIHHHIGHRAVGRAEIGLKGLYEFAAGLQALTDGERLALAGRASRHPRLLAIIELWIAAAAELLAIPVPPELAPAPDVIDWWQQMNGDAPVKGRGPELRAALNRDRMLRAEGGSNPFRRAYWRLAVPLSFTKLPMWLR